MLLTSSRASARERVVVLRNGNTFAGNVTEMQDRVVIQQESSQLVFELREVDLVAESFDEAYRRKAARVPRGNLVAREKLLSWCVQHHLPKYAWRQLEILEREHPNASHSDVWKQRIESHARLGGKNVLPPMAPPHPDTVLAQDVTSSLGKLAHAGFVRKIQPILLNRCGLASCHGRGTTSDYQLIRARAPLARSITQRNLGASLRQIGEGPAQQSLLWLSAIEVHGGAKKMAITNSELAQLLDWIVTVNQDLSGGERPVVGSDKSTPFVADPFDPAEFNQIAK